MTVCASLLGGLLGFIGFWCAVLGLGYTWIAAIWVYLAVGLTCTVSCVGISYVLATVRLYRQGATSARKTA